MPRYRLEYEFTERDPVSPEDMQGIINRFEAVVDDMIYPDGDMDRTTTLLEQIGEGCWTVIGDGQ